MTFIPNFTDIDSKSRDAIRDLAVDWLDSPFRPCLHLEEISHWDKLIDEWVNDPSMPLLIRKTGNRGQLLQHVTGRPLVIVDNSPANWCYACAILGRRPTRIEVQTALEKHNLPVAMMFKKEELPFATYRGLLGRVGEVPNLNAKGWKVCHIKSVGLNDKTPVQAASMSLLVQHTTALLHPQNMFLVPKIYAGLGELPEFIDVFRQVFCNEDLLLAPR